MSKLEYMDKYPQNTTTKGFILKGMWVTLKTMVRTTLPGRRPMTIQYPYEKEVIPDNYRGRPGLVMNKCIGCGICAKICPTTCIEIIEIDHPELGKVKRPQVNLGRCMMCGYCAEYCPKDAMVVTPEYELASYTRKGLIFDPYELQWDAVPGNEVHMEEVLASEINDPNAKYKAYYDLDRPEADDSKCIGCGRCAKTCPASAIEMIVVGKNEKGKDIKRPKFDGDLCVACEQCVDVCPKSCIELKEVL